MKNKLLWFSLVLFVMASCTRTPGPTPPQPGESDPSFDFNVPANFDWSVHKSVAVTVHIADAYQGKYNYAIELYDQNPMVTEDAKLLDRGVVKGDNVYKANINTLKTVETIYVVQTDPLANRAVVAVAIDANSAMYDFRANRVKSESRAFAASEKPKGIVVPAGVIPVPDNGVLKSGNKYLVAEGETVELFLKSDVELYVAGSVDIKNSNYFFEKNYTLAVLPTGKVSYKGGLDLSEMMIRNEGLFSVSKNLSLYDVDIHNSGVINLETDLILYKKSEINNSGKIAVKGSLTATSNSYISNSGYVDVEQNMTLTNEADIENNGNIDIKHTLTINYADIQIGALAMLRCKDFVGVDTKIVLASDAKFVIDHKADFSITAEVKCSDATDRYAVVIIGHSAVINIAKNFSGKIVIDAKTLTSQGVFDSSVIIGNPGSAVISIPVSEFNDNGYNPTVIDPGEEENEGDKEIVYYDPTYITLFEDNYPRVGAMDMDMNDVVIKWQFGLMKNIDNKVVKMGIRYSVVALGGSKRVAAAVELKAIEKSLISAVKISKPQTFSKYFEVNNGLENGVLTSVIPLFEDGHKLFGIENPIMINTSRSEIYLPSYEDVIEIELTSAQDASVITNEKDNISFFIVFKGDKRSRTEIRQFGHSVTSKAVNSSVDFANASSIWGLQFEEGFRYPYEGVNIGSAYPKFQNWVESMGASEKEWFNHPDASKVVKRK